MRVRVVLEVVYRRTPDGAVMTDTPLHCGFFSRYREVFSAVEVVARVTEVSATPPGWRPVGGEGIQVHALPFYHGLWGYLRQRGAVIAALREAVSGDGAIILRVPSPLAGCLDRQLATHGIPYGVEVIGDPWDVFAPGVVAHPLRPFLRHHFRAQLRRQCRQAAAGCFVTNHTLQRRYPLGQSAPAFAVSDVELGEDAFVPCPREPPIAGQPLRLIMVGSLAQLYKAPDVLLSAVAACTRRGMDLRLEIVGDGIYREQLTRLAMTLGIAERVRFAGQLVAGAAVRERLDAADLFVLPSRTEGLPRAIIEAMARGLPCLGSTAGGIPELLPTDALAPPGDAQALADLLWARGRDGRWMKAAAVRNLAFAQGFAAPLLHAQRAAFYRMIRDATETWMQKR